MPQKAVEPPKGTRGLSAWRSESLRFPHESKDRLGRQRSLARPLLAGSCLSPQAEIGQKRRSAMTRSGQLHSVMALKIQ